jgi:Protein of unknown function (DUF2934)
MAAPKKPKSPAVRAGKTETTTTAKKVNAAETARVVETAREMVSPTISGNDVAADAPTAEMIRVRAYEIFLGRNGSYGDEVSDWLAAERALLEKL